MDASIEMDNCRQALCVCIWVWIKCYSESPGKCRSSPGPGESGASLRIIPNRNSPDIDDLERQLLESKSGVAQARANAGLKADLYVQCGLSQTGTTFNQAYTNPNDQQQVRVGFPYRSSTGAGRTGESGEIQGRTLGKYRWNNNGTTWK